MLMRTLYSLLVPQTDLTVCVPKINAVNCDVLCRSIAQSLIYKRRCYYLRYTFNDQYQIIIKIQLTHIGKHVGLLIILFNSVALASPVGCTVQQTAVARLEVVSHTLNFNSYIFMLSLSIVTWFKTLCFLLPAVLRDAALFRSTAMEELSASVWDRCQHSIVKNLGTYTFEVAIPVQKFNNGWWMQRADYSSRGWMIYHPFVDNWK